MDQPETPTEQPEEPVEQPEAPVEPPPPEVPADVPIPSPLPISSETTTTQWEFLFPVIEKESFTKVSQNVREDLSTFLTQFSEKLENLYEAIDQNPCRTWGVSSSPVSLHYPYPTERTIDQFFEEHDDDIIYPIKLLTQFIDYINKAEKKAKEEYYSEISVFGETAEPIVPPHDSLMNNDCDIPAGQLEELTSKILPMLKSLASFLPEYFSVGQRFIEYILFLYSPENPLYNDYFQSTVLSSAFSALGRFLKLLYILTTLINENPTLITGWTEYRKMMITIRKDPSGFGVTEDDLSYAEPIINQIHRIVFGGDLLQLFFNAIEKFIPIAPKLFSQMLERYLENEIIFYTKRSKNVEFCEHDDEICDITLLLHFLTLFKPNIKPKIISNIFSTYQIIPIVKLYHYALFSQIMYMRENMTKLLLQVIGVNEHKSSNQKLLQQLNATNSTLGQLCMKLFTMFSSWQSRCQNNIIEGIELCYFIRSSICRTADLHQSFDKPIGKTSIEHIGRMIELLKAVQHTFFLNQSAISHNLPKVVDTIVQIFHTQLKSTAQTMKKKQYRSIRSRASNLTKLAYHCVRFISSSYSAPCLEIISDLFSSKPLNGLGFTRNDIIQNLRKINLLQNCNEYIDDACNCSYLIDSIDNFRYFLKAIISAPRRIIFLAQAMNDVADMVKKNNELYLTFEKIFIEMIRKEFISPILSQIETELRFHTHEHLSVSERNPLKKQFSDFDKFLTIPPFRIMTRFIDIQYEASYYFTQTFYKETSVSPQVWETYTEMANMANELYGINVLDCHLPGSMMQQDIDVLEIMRNINVFVSCYNYDLNSQVFIQRAEGSHYISIVGIPHIFSSYRSHGIGIMNTTVDFTYRFLRTKFNIFSKFLFDENVKSRLINDISWFETHKEEVNGLWPYKRAEKFVTDMKRFAENAQSPSPLDKFRVLITEIGNALGFVRMVKNGGTRYLNKANDFVYDEDESLSFYEFAKEVQLPDATMDATKRLDSIVGKLKELFNSNDSFFKMLVDVFAGPFRDKNNTHLHNFFAIIPSLTLSYIDHIMQLKDKAMIENKNSSYSDDGFPLGIAYILKLLAQDEVFDTLHWFDSLKQHTNEQIEDVKNNANKSATHQVSVFDTPTDIVAHCPSLAERFPFHLDAFLYQSPPSPERVIESHKKMCALLAKESGARVWTVREILSQMSEEKLRSLLLDSADCKFEISPNAKLDNLSKKMSRNYFDYSLSKLNKDNLIDLLMLHPTVTIKIDQSSTGFSATTIPVSPLSNFMFTRDQQITTAKGVVMGRFAAPQRSFENILMKHVWNQLGITPIGQIYTPGVLEGGDFIPLGRELALLGVGLRTNMVAARQLMREDLVGTERFVIVEDVRDLSSQRTHLDTIFSPLDDQVCICLDKVAQDDPRYIRIVHEFVRRDGQYVQELQMPFGKWLRNQGYTIVMASLDQQKDYFMNNLQLGRDVYGHVKILAINPEVERTLKSHGFNGNIVYADLSEMTAMYGGVHSLTQVLRSHN
ncbi:WASH complex subunit 7 [Histomonas meleagridis]|uniref:WASH complex subunit 7 n=1 Tax=Histomonas meleagridis TaxID=135588 RepID=UPI00355A82C8|nr:WASH complex subunit 7 [Histomonas meleagridis]KAH0797826.1 WASH complex subunit 7 [Histomonas meleagridis]